MKKFWVTTLIIVVILALMAVFTKNSFVLDSLSNESKKPGVQTTDTAGVVSGLLQNIGMQKFHDQDLITLNHITEYIDTTFANNHSNIKAKAATFDYLKQRLEALYSPNKEQVNTHYKQAYTAMSCVMYLMGDSGGESSPEVLLLSINEKFLADQEFKKRQESADILLNGEIFIDMPQAEKERTCNAIYN